MSALTPTAPPTTGSFQGISDVKLVGRQVWYEQLSFWLNPVGAVFTVGFSLVFLLLLGATEHGVPSRDASSIRSFVVRAGAIDVSQVTAILEESPR